MITTDKISLLNWVSDPWGSALTWLADHTVALFRGPVVVVPDVRDMSVVEARSALARAALRFRVVEPAAAPPLAMRIVVSQEPPPGRQVRKRSVVTVFAEEQQSHRSAYA